MAYIPVRQRPCMSLVLECVPTKLFCFHLFLFDALCFYQAWVSMQMCTSQCVPARRCQGRVVTDTRIKNHSFIFRNCSILIGVETGQEFTGKHKTGLVQASIHSNLDSIISILIYCHVCGNADRTFFTVTRDTSKHVSPRPPTDCDHDF